MKASADGSFEISPEEVGEIIAGTSNLVISMGVPKNKSKKIGLVIALDTENDKEKMRLENDLFAELSHNLSVSGVGNDFHLIKYPPKFSKKIKNTESANHFLRISKAHFMVYGSITQRNIEGKNSYVCRLHGLVRHIPIPNTSEVKERLQEDFSVSLPSKLFFAEDQELLGFEMTRSLISYSARFIVGFAAMLSKDYLLGYRLFKDLHQELEKMPARIEHDPIVSEIYKRNKNHLAESIILLTAVDYRKYELDRNKSHILEQEILIDELQAIQPENYYGHLTKAMALFEKGEVDLAIAELANNSISLEGTGHYSLGFLYVCKGDIDAALDHYRRASYKKPEGRILNDIEIFLTEEISKQNENETPLVFFRGLLNYKAKEDYALARKDFESFLKKKGARNYSRLQDLAQKYLSGIQEAGY